MRSGPARTTTLESQSRLDSERGLRALIGAVLAATTGQTATTDRAATLLVDGARDPDADRVLTAVTDVARRLDVTVLGPPTDGCSWDELLDELHAGPLVVCVPDAGAVPPPVLAAIGWLAERFPERPVAWLIVFDDPERLIGFTAEAHDAFADRARVHVALGSAGVPGG